MSCERSLDAVVAGHVCLDITPVFGRAGGGTIGEILRPGKLLRMEGVQTSPGGAVGNTGPALYRLGFRVALMGKCGRDPFGRLLVERLRYLAPGAETGMQIVEGENTSYTIVLAPPGIDRIFLHCPDANDSFGPEDVDLQAVGGCRLFHFGYPPLMRRMFADGGEQAAEILSRAGDAGSVVTLDLSLPDPDSDAGQADWPAILARMMPHVDCFLPSLDELLFMIDRPRFDELSASDSIADGISADDLRRLADACLEMGAGVTVIKCGHAGAYLKTRQPGRAFSQMVGSANLWNDREIFEPSCCVNRMVNATGAGDAAIAGFLAACLKGESPERAMAFLVTVGAQNLAAFDAVSGVRSWEETRAAVDAGVPRNPLPSRLDGLNA